MMSRHKTSILKLGYSCNNNCLFCRVSDKKKENLSREQVFEKIRKKRENGSDSLIITGGEPTIRKDIVGIVAYAKKLGFRIIHIESNGRMFYYKNFIRMLIENGANSFSTALQSLNEGVHNELTSQKSFGQVMAGIENLKEFNIGKTNNVTITKLNYKELPDLVDFFINQKADHLQLIFVQPTGNAGKNYERIVPDFEETEKFLRKSLETGEKAGMKITTEGFPLCYMKGHERNMIEFLRDKMEASGPDLEKPDFFKKRMVFFTEDCKKCMYRLICPGSWEEIRKAGRKTRPVEGDPFLTERNFIKNLPDRYYVDFLSLESGLKKLIRMMVKDEREYKELKKFAEEFKLKIARSKYKVETKNGIFCEKTLPFNGTGHFFVYVSRDYDVLKKAMEYEGNDFGKKDDRKLGELLGYPECCINNFIEKEAEGRRDFVMENWKSSGENPSYLLNFVLDFSPFHLISHFPCSFNCKKSKEIAGNLLEIMKKENFLLSRETEEYLKMPVLYSKDRNFILFRGTANEKVIKYNDFFVFSSQKNTFKESLIGNLKEGNEIEISGKNLLISRDGTKIQEYKVPKNNLALINFRDG